jgi:hypothetical protein
MWTNLPFFNTSDQVARKARRNALPAHDRSAGLTKRVTVHLLALTCIHAHTTQAPTRTDDVHFPSILVSGLAPSWGACFGSRVLIGAWAGAVDVTVGMHSSRASPKRQRSQHAKQTCTEHAARTNYEPRLRLLRAPNSRLRGPTAAGALSRRPAAPRSG